MKSGKLTSQEFCGKYLPPNWAERDLQTYCQRVLRQRRGMGIFLPPDEVVIPTPNSRRRADIATLTAIYEVKCWLSYDNIYHAVAQTELYMRYGGKIIGVIPKQRVIIGVAPIDYNDYQSALRLAKDFSNLKGIKVIFINECPEWHLHSMENFNANKYLLWIIYLLSLFIIVTVVLVFR